MSRAATVVAVVVTAVLVNLVAHAVGLGAGGDFTFTQGKRIFTARATC